VNRPEELVPAYEAALAVDDRPALVHVRTDPNENCYPMWPAGQSIETMVVSDPRKKKS
jgi:thiamine pyrophosphate-dependent acetolactate synthase large subunit-like protein